MGGGIRVSEAPRFPGRGPQNLDQIKSTAAAKRYGDPNSGHGAISPITAEGKTAIKVAFVNLARKHVAEGLGKSAKAAREIKARDLDVVLANNQEESEAAK